MESKDGAVVPVGCESCPNRAVKSRGSVHVSYLLALIVTSLMLGASYEYKGTGGVMGWHPKDPPPIQVWFMLLPVIGWFAGVPVPRGIFGGGNNSVS